MSRKVAVSFVAVVFQTKYKEAGKKEASTSLYSTLPETLETQHAKEASQLQSEVRTWAAHLMSVHYIFCHKKFRGNPSCY